jgi:hypothetical protein
MVALRIALLLRLDVLAAGTGDFSVALLDLPDLRPSSSTLYRSLLTDLADVLPECLEC